MVSIKNATKTVLSISLIVPLLLGCVGGKSNTDSTHDVAPESGDTQQISSDGKLALGSLEEIQVNAPINSKFDNIVIGKFTNSQQFSKDYPDAVTNCSDSIVKQLKNKNIYKSVSTIKTQQLKGKSAVVDIEITDMRIASSSARMWGGVFAGSSFMDVKVKVREAEKKEVLHEKLLTTSNNAWAASYSGGSSDRNLPADFGVLIGEYLSKVIPAK